MSFANDADNGNDTFYYNTDTDSAIIPAGTRKGLTYTESGIIARNPTDKQTAVRLRPASPNQKPRMFPIRPANWPRPLPAGSPRAVPQPRRWPTH